MAVQQSNSAPSAPASSRPYSRARTGYGKRSASGQRPSTSTDFDLLPARERYIAGYVDHLPDGAAMDIKTLAKDLPLYGQMAIGSALRALAVAGHLRHVRCRVESLGQSRWVTLTFWSRTARDNEWWDLQLAGGAGVGEPEPEAVTGEPGAPVVHVAPVAPVVPQQRAPKASEAVPAGPSPAYLALARLGRVEPRLALSAADCAALEGLAATWFAHGADADHLTRALTAGLPEQVGSPVGLVRRRLIDKVPARLPDTVPAPASPARALLVECTECGRPGPPGALPDGLCRACRQSPPSAPGEPVAERDIEAHMRLLREKLRLP
ncbi:MarR family transcriptional regulator [Streptomyces sp. NBC_00059]|uniref:MarR family transcriptional regulator n=1 Tax=Streptomyces sp. NBC_00059 TaxID=2975635 RepID=UPI00225130E6|nr:MarR family transcriptional regulator [Streptomyces sp. NBC_00059]MCX5411971.1 MarR family transcriptional regulator [Streptomyces sp. NBC_00059]